MMLNKNEINSELDKLDGWVIDENKIVKNIPMHNWKGVLMLANTIAHLSEVAWHHPDLILTYSSITINLTSHDADGLTMKDFDLAKKIDEVIGWNPRKDGGSLTGTPTNSEHRYLN